LALLDKKEIIMKLNTQAILFASAVALIPPASVLPASARAAVTVDFGNVAVGYRDGYRDSNHQYHRWAHRQDAQRYRSQYSQNYRDMTHDRDHDNR
jgi:hypothetical protein